MKYQICTRCVMDTTEPEIRFDKNGYCSYCSEALRIMPQRWHRDGKAEFDKIVERIKKENADQPFDCLVGISGGLDSSYVAYLCHQYGLRVLGLHVDGGWDTEISEGNIKKLVKAYQIHLETIKIDEAVMMDLQRAYFLSGVYNQDVPQDHAFFAALFKYAQKNHIKYVFNGTNYASESILGTSRGFDSKDAVNLIDIHAHFGKRALTGFPLMKDEKFFYVDLPNQLQLQNISPLNYFDYNLQNAISTLSKDCGFVYYGGKHLESVFTRLFQNYIHPIKYHHDKRRDHLSSLIIAGQMTREEALKILATPHYASEEEKEADISTFISRIGISREEFDRIIQQEPVDHRTYKINSYSKQFYRRKLLKSLPGATLVLKSEQMKSFLKKWI